MLMAPSYTVPYFFNSKEATDSLEMLPSINNALDGKNMKLNLDKPPRVILDSKMGNI